MKTIMLEFLLPIFTALFYFFFENVVIFSIIIVVAVVAWWKYGISARKSMEIASYVGVVVFVLWFIATNWGDDDDEPLPDTQTSQSDVPVVETDRQDTVALPQNTPTPSTDQPTKAAPDNPHERLMAQGIWYDPKTKLYWDRCSIGQTWDGQTCQGTALELNWQDAQDYVKQFTNQQAKGGFSNWRVPTIKELASIRHCSGGWEKEDTGTTTLTEQGRVAVYKVSTALVPNNQDGKIQISRRCADNSTHPTVNEQIFPNAPTDWHWSSSPHKDYDTRAWSVRFSDGSVGYQYRDGGNRVRAVRSE